tara:strand:- start:2366 stop:2905 length:540 start_codon:yes stop_codon:yes gene_type:complete
MADYKTWMLTGYRQNHTNGREGLQYFHVSGLVNHRYFSDTNGQDIANWNTSYTVQSDHGAFSNSNGRYYCYSEGVFFSTVTLMYTNPNTKDFHVALYKNGSRISLSNDHAGGGGSNGHTWNGATTSALCRVAEGDYITCRAIASSGATSNPRGYLYGGSDYNGWQGYYLAGAQRDDPST